MIFLFQRHQIKERLFQRGKSFQSTAGSLESSINGKFFYFVKKLFGNFTGSFNGSAILPRFQESIFKPKPSQ